MGTPGLLGIAEAGMTKMYGVRAFTEAEAEELIARIVELYPRMKRRAIARRLGVCQSTVGRYAAVARERGLLPPSERVRPQEVRDALVADLAKPGWSLTELARKYGYTKAGVYYHAVQHGFHIPYADRP